MGRPAKPRYTRRCAYASCDAVFTTPIERNVYCSNPCRLKATGAERRDQRLATMAARKAAGLTRAGRPVRAIVTAFDVMPGLLAECRRELAVWDAERALHPRTRGGKRDITIKQRVAV